LTRKYNKIIKSYLGIDNFYRTSKVVEEKPQEQLSSKITSAAKS